MVSVQFYFDWKAIAALGLGVSAAILASKVDSSGARDTLVSAADAVSVSVAQIDDISKS